MNNGRLKEFILKIFFCRRNYAVERKRFAIDDVVFDSEISCIQETRSTGSSSKSSSNELKNKSKKNDDTNERLHSTDVLMNGSRRNLSNNLRMNNENDRDKGKGFKNNSFYKGDNINTSRLMNGRIDSNVSVESTKINLSKLSIDSNRSHNTGQTSSKNSIPGGESDYSTNDADQRKISDFVYDNARKINESKRIIEYHNDSNSNVDQRKANSKEIFLTPRSSRIKIARTKRNSVVKNRLASTTSFDVDDYAELSNDKNFKKVSLHDTSSSESLESGEKKEFINQKSSESNRFVEQKHYKPGKEETETFNMKIARINEEIEKESSTAQIEDILKEELIKEGLMENQDLIEESLEAFLFKEAYESESIEEETEVSCSVNFCDKKKFNKEFSKKLLEILKKGTREDEVKK